MMTRAAAAVLLSVFIALFGTALIAQFVSVVRACRALMLSYVSGRGAGSVSSPTQPSCASG